MHYGLVQVTLGEKTVPVFIYCHQVRGLVLIGFLFRLHRVHKMWTVVIDDPSV